MQLSSKIIRLILASTMLASAALACAQAGQIVPDAEATKLASPTATESLDVSADAEFQIGETAIIVGGTFGVLVPLYGAPNGRIFTSQVPANIPVVVLQLGQDAEGVIWYEVDGQAGSGWIRGANLRAAEEGEAQSAE